MLKPAKNECRLLLLSHEQREQNSTPGPTLTPRAMRWERFGPHIYAHKKRFSDLNLFHVIIFIKTFASKFPKCIGTVQLNLGLWDVNELIWLFFSPLLHPALYKPDVHWKYMTVWVVYVSQTHSKQSCTEYRLFYPLWNIMCDLISILFLFFFFAQEVWHVKCS